MSVPEKVISVTAEVNLTIEYVITVTLKIISATTKVILAANNLMSVPEKEISVTAEVNLTIEYVITVTLKIISATTKVILATNKLVLVTAEYSDLISNLLPGPFLFRCDAMAGCIGNGIMLNIIQQGFLWILMISSLIS